MYAAFSFIADIYNIDTIIQFEISKKSISINLSFTSTQSLTYTTLVLTLTENSFS